MGIFGSSQSSEDIKNACLAYAQNLEVKINQLVAEAQEAVDSPDTLSTTQLRRISHHYQRLVAGHHQMRDLVIQGKSAIEAAIEDEVIILEGQR